jgi:hypothetical protein
MNKKSWTKKEWPKKVTELVSTPEMNKLWSSPGLPGKFDKELFAAFIHQRTKDIYKHPMFHDPREFWYFYNRLSDGIRAIRLLSNDPKIKRICHDLENVLMEIICIRPGTKKSKKASRQDDQSP